MTIGQFSGDLSDRGNEGVQQMRRHSCQEGGPSNEGIHVFIVSLDSIKEQLQPDARRSLYPRLMPSILMVYETWVSRM